MAKTPKTFSDQIREAIDASGLSRYAICNEIGISQSTMSRFMHHQGGLSMTSLDKLAELLGLSVATRTKRPTKGE